ncbi:MAG: hypothetical protein AB1390_02365 [Nitrospirota bacterium]
MQNATAMIWKLLQVVEKSFRSLKGYWLLHDVYKGIKFVDGVIKHEIKAIEMRPPNAFYTPVDKPPCVIK